jgi:type II secretory pathway pseudopilin PulG
MNTPSAKSANLIRLGDKLAAFTLLELMVLIGCLALLAMTVLPVLAKSRPNSTAFQCLNNNRQLCAAWRMYADDNHDLMVYASVSGGTGINPQDQYAWTASQMDFNPANRGNWDTNADIVLRPLWPYTARDASIYRCPADKSFVVVSGVSRPRVRSYSMNYYLGGFAGSSGGLQSNYRIYLKTTDLRDPSPAKMLVFLEERWDVINWGNFYIDMTGYSPPNPNSYQFNGDYPGLIHDLASSVSFGDCHAEIHRWRDPRTTPQINILSPLPPAESVPRDVDVAWLQDHASRVK